MSNTDKFIINTYLDACQIKRNNKRITVFKSNERFIIQLKNHDSDINKETFMAKTKYLGRKTCITEIHLTLDTLYSIYVAIGKVLKLSDLKETNRTI
jgi:ribosomal protein L18